ncbi:hypothetical protein OsJ_19639 [Oryza sativa Japonica Group]|uniref:Uncharacterized protein n=1 Tax=Oryza sativa subsp. japonica TaxID=39947 RepID=B9FLR0_ORYSJ|nr:hypothetical protein OsJ_19639 [Oryza sativa Japonica Group]
MAQFGGFGGWSAMDVAAAAAAALGNVSGAVYHADPAAAVYASLVPGMAVVPGRAPPSAVQIEAARRWKELEKMALRSVNLMVTCAGAIQAGDYAAAAGSLSDAREIFAKMPTTRTGIGRVLTHFADALAERLFPAFPQSAPPPPPPRGEQRELFRGFYEAGPYLKFAHLAANQAILEAFEGCNSVHVIDFALTDGIQWPSLIQALAVRPGGPPFLRITGIGPHAAGNRDELRDVGLRLAEFARSCSVPFAFRGIAADQLDGLRPWMFQVAPGEAVAINSVLQLHRLLVDQDAAAAASFPAPIDGRARLGRVHEPQGLHGGRAGGGSQQVVAAREAAMQLREFSGAGFGVQENGGFLTLTWHSQRLYSASAWRATAGKKMTMMASGAADAMEESQNSNTNGGGGGSSGGGHGALNQIMQ